MASIAIMIGGEVLNAAAFTGGNYRAKYIARLRWPKKRGMTKRWKLSKRRWKNTRASARSFLTGLKLTDKSKLGRIKTSQTPITRSSSTTRPTPTTN